MTSSFVRFTSSLALALGLVITPSFAEDTKAAVKKAAKAKATESAEAKAAKATEKPAAKVEAAAAKTEGVAAKSAAKGVAAKKAETAVAADQCTSMTQDGDRCKRKAAAGSKFCWQHDPKRVKKS